MTPLKSRDSKLSIDTIQSWLTRMRTNNASFPHLFARIAALLGWGMRRCSGGGRRQKSKTFRIKTGRSMQGHDKVTSRSCQGQVLAKKRPRQ